MQECSNSVHTFTLECEYEDIIISVSERVSESVCLSVYNRSFLGLCKRVHSYNLIVYMYVYL